MTLTQIQRRIDALNANLFTKSIEEISNELSKISTLIEKDQIESCKELTK